MPDTFPPLPSEIVADVLAEHVGLGEDAKWRQSAYVMEALTAAGYLILRGDRLPAARWNVDKPHRCPRCHAVAVDLERPRWWRVYTCCRCGARFARWPWLAPVLNNAGVRCSEHRTSPERADHADCD